MWFSFQPAETFFGQGCRSRFSSGLLRFFSSVLRRFFVSPAWTWQASLPKPRGDDGFFVGVNSAIPG
jgi:hypothetical protein